MKRVAFQNKSRIAWLLLAPQLLITAIFFLWPTFVSLKSAFFLADPFGLSNEFVWFENFGNIFFDPTYLYAIFISTLISLLVALISMGFSLFLAVMAQGLTGRISLVYRLILIIPYAVAPVVSGVFWRFLFDPSIGIIAGLIQKAGMTWSPYTDAGNALTLIVIASAWKQISYNFLFFLAALHYVPKSLTEAAIMDKARPWKRFWTITFPMLSPTTFFLLVVNIIYAFFETFGVIDVTTRGGPEYSTSTLVYRVYRDGFVSLDLGSASAQSAILLIIVGILTIIQFRFIERKAHYG